MQSIKLLRRSLLSGLLKLRQDVNVTVNNRLTQYILIPKDYPIRSRYKYTFSKGVKGIKGKKYKVPDNDDDDDDRNDDTDYEIEDRFEF